MPRTILLIEDDAIVAGTVLGLLRDEDFHVEWIRHCSEGERRLNRAHETAEPRITAVLARLQLPDSEGLVTVDRLVRAAAHVPVLVIADPGEEIIAQQAVQRGAQDYLLTVHLDSSLLPKAIGNMIERSATFGALYHEKELAQATLNSIGDAVLSMDRAGMVSYLNVVAERLTGWTAAEASGRALKDVFRILDATTREETAEPLAVAMRENRTVALTPNCVLVRRDGAEVAIEDSAAPIHDRRGNVIGAVMVFHDVSEARAMALRMAYLAQHDGLTGLPNRILFKDRLRQALVLAERRRDRVAVLYVDLDRFKHTNDTLGHGTGDALLQTVATRLRECVRTSDTVSRHGGDEFVVLLPQISDCCHVEKIARKILIAMRAPCLIEGRTLHFTASIGISIYPDDGVEGDSLLRHADFAMYLAKDNGRDHFQFYGPEVNTRSAHRHSSFMR